ncbi:MAG: NAD+ synthase [Ottowia sp.]|nr:NAD+ synthase [Ottowia sp.]
MSLPIRFALAQLNLTVGDIAGNVTQLIDAARIAHAQGVDVLLTPELSLPGYTPEDWLLRPAFLHECELALITLAQALEAFPGLHMVVGYPCCVDTLPAVATPPCYNRAAVLCEGRVVGHYDKQRLPNYAVFDEQRYFQAGAHALVWTVKGLRLGLVICEDVWSPFACQQAVAAGAQCMLVINASPYHLGKEQEREAMLRLRVQETGVPYVYVNLVGGQDELVFDGASCAVDKAGQVVFRMPSFVAATALLDYQQGQWLVVQQTVATQMSIEAQLYGALKLGVADYVRKNNFPGVVIGLSGGVDSALVLAIACDALGADKVHAVMMPSCYTAEISRHDACEMAQGLGVRYTEIAIAPMVDAFSSSLASFFSTYPEDATEENIQARVRGTLLMALSNKTGRLVLTTSNKSEMAVGYCTLYGDMAGGFAVLKDVAKTWVYRLCAWRNMQSMVIPQRILTRAPSAELRDNQTDQDTLPDYEIVDAIVSVYMEQNGSAAALIAQGYPAADVKQVIRLIHQNEHKRRQAPVGVRVTARAFGRDWRYPIRPR